MHFPRTHTHSTTNMVRLLTRCLELATFDTVTEEDGKKEAPHLVIAFVIYVANVIMSFLLPQQAQL